MQLCVLASGSAGNCTVVRTPRGTLLIDAGLGPRATATRLAAANLCVGPGVGLGVGLGADLRASSIVGAGDITGLTARSGAILGLADISAICLTHLDRDHFKLNWIETIVRRRIAVHCHRSRVDDLLRLADDSRLAALVRPFGVGGFDPLPGITLLPVPLAHDGDGSHGFVVQALGTRLGFATDLGRVPGSLIDAFHQLDFLAIESNYDPDMQRRSGRPDFLKRRIMGGRGHLSNEQAFEAVRTIIGRGQRAGHGVPRHLVLLHRSRQCNCPILLRKLFAADRRVADRLTLAEQDAPTRWLCVGPRFVGEQMMLNW